ncbi:MAG TPA: SRPBCC family protein [Acidimicrobiia bacterium]|nr:SRPBCC family protein [Acidimicrobiia bacterium]
MARIAVQRSVDADQSVVWERLADLASHVTWMRDAEWIVFVGDQTSGEGTRMEVKTVVGPFRTIDEMEVIGWDEGRSIAVEHRGLIQGSGVLEVRPRDAGSVVSWTEDLRFPWWLGGPVTAWLARPVLAAIWRGNLRRLEETLRSP